MRLFKLHVCTNLQTQSQAEKEAHRKTQETLKEVEEEHKKLKESE